MIPYRTVQITSLMLICFLAFVSLSTAQSLLPKRDSSLSSIAIVAQANPESQPTVEEETQEQPETSENIFEEGNEAESPAISISSEDRKALIILAVGIITVLGLIIVLKVNAFISLITAAIVVSLLAPGEIALKISRVASAFGSSAGSIGIVIALAAVIGKCMLDSGAADRVVRAFLQLLGEKRSPIALMGSGFVLAVPVFFDTVFYLLVPLARSLHRRTGKQYLKYILAIGAGAAITHTLVPPTPGPLLMASNLGIDVGMMIMIGGLVALPAALVGLLMAGLTDRFMNVPMRQIGSEPEPEPLDDSQLPSLFMSLLPVLLPVVMISTNTVLTTKADSEHAALLSVEEVSDWPAFRNAIQQDAALDGPSPGKRILEVLDNPEAKDSEQMQEVAQLLRQQEPLTDEQKKKVIDEFNQSLLPDKSFHEEESFLGVLMNDTAKNLLGKGRLRMKKVDAERMNRAVLESSFNQGEIALVTPHVWETPWRKAANVSALFGNANLALLISTIIAMWVMVKQRNLSRAEMAKVVEISLMSGGVIILITAGGGAFGAMLTAANVGDAIRNMFQITDGADAGLMFLVLGFTIAAVLKVAQGSSTVAMITGSAMLVGIASPETLGFHPVYLATAIGGGSLVGVWMNDSGFWIFAKMGGLTEVETLKAWSSLVAVLGLTSFGVTLALAKFMPLI